MEVNVLISSVSNKVWLVKAFQRALRLEDDIQGKVISIDKDKLSAGLYKSDKYYPVLSSESSEFIPSILRICEKEKINLIVPTRDGELLRFAENKSLFKKKGIQVAVSSAKAIRICRDKYRFSKFLEEEKIPTPKTFLPEEVKRVDSKRYPLLVKPRRGSSSVGIYKVNDQRELEFFLSYIPQPIIQEFVEGKEYTIDLFSDFEKNVISIVPRERILTRGGESIKGKTVKDKKAINYALKISKAFGFCGAITLQYIIGKEGIKFIEVNPRFGGGCALGIAAGANSPLFLVQIIAGRKIENRIWKFKEGLVMLRYTEDLYLNGVRG